MRHHLSCYLLSGYEGDTIPAFWERVRFLAALNVMCFPQFWRGEVRRPIPSEWRDAIAQALTMGGARG